MSKVTKTVETGVNLCAIEQTGGVAALREFIKTEKKVYAFFIKDLAKEVETQGVLDSPDSLLQLLLGSPPRVKKVLQSFKAARRALVAACFPDIWDESESYRLDPEKEILTFAKTVEETKDNH